MLAKDFGCFVFLFVQGFAMEGIYIGLCGREWRVLEVSVIDFANYKDF